MAHGALEIALGLVYGAFSLSAHGDGAVRLHLVPAEMVSVVTVLAVLLVAAGALKLGAGLRNHGYRDRNLGRLALASGAVAVLTCVLAPTALALMAYGFRVYARPWPQAR
jgi:hypothetical protein